MADSLTLIAGLWLLGFALLLALHLILNVGSIARRIVALLWETPEQREADHD